MSDGTDQHDDLQLLDERIEELMGMLDDLPEPPASSDDDAAEDVAPDGPVADATPEPTPEPESVAPPEADPVIPDGAVDALDAPSAPDAPEAPEATEPAPDDSAPEPPVEAPAPAPAPPAPTSNGTGTPEVPDGPLEEQDITALLELTAQELRGEVPMVDVPIHGLDTPGASNGAGASAPPAEVASDSAGLKADNRTIAPEAPASPAPDIDADTIAELDEALAGRAAEALTDDSEAMPSADDLAGAFGNASDAPAEPVAEAPEPVAETPEPIEDATPEPEAADETAEAVTPEPVAAPAAEPAPEPSAPAAAEPAPEVVVASGGILRTVAQKAEPALETVAIKIDGLMSGLEPRHRQTVKYVAIYAACNTVALWGYLLFRRPPPPPPPADDARVELRLDNAPDSN